MARKSIAPSATAISWSVMLIGRAFFRKLLRNQAIHPESIITDKLASYRAAARELGLTSRHHPGGMRANNRSENSHLPIRRRERKQQNSKPQGSAQRFLATHAAVYNTFNTQPTSPPDRPSGSSEPEHARSGRTPPRPPDLRGGGGAHRPGSR